MPIFIVLLRIMGYILLALLGGCIGYYIGLNRNVETRKSVFRTHQEAYDNGYYQGVKSVMEELSLDDPWHPLSTPPKIMEKKAEEVVDALDELMDDPDLN